MSITREARHLSGNDLGKTITNGRITGTIGAITHHDGFARVILDPPMADGTHTLSVLHHVPVTITGQPSPHTENPHGLQIRSEPEWASIYRPLGFTTVDEALGTPCPCFNPAGHGHYHPACPQYCSRCNYQQHICPGCGDQLRHGTNVCPDCVTRLDEKAAEQETGQPLPFYDVGFHATTEHDQPTVGKCRILAPDGETARTIARQRLKEQGLKDVGIEYTTRQDQP